MEKERDVNMVIAAETLKSSFDEYIKAGFSESQAMQIILKILEVTFLQYRGNKK